MEQVTPERAASEMRRTAAAFRTAKPGDPYFEEVANGNERIAGIIDQLRSDLAAARAEVATANQCDVCGGSGVPVSGLPCICGGTGRGSDEKIGLRKEVHAARAEVEALRAVEQWMREDPDGPLRAMIVTEYCGPFGVSFSVGEKDTGPVDAQSLGAAMAKALDAARARWEKKA